MILWNVGHEAWLRAPEGRQCEARAQTRALDQHPTLSDTPMGHHSKGHTEEAGPRSWTVKAGLFLPATEFLKTMRMGKDY